MNTQRTILDAATKRTTLAAALAYCELGISVIPLDGKILPTIASSKRPMRWAQYQIERASWRKINGWHRYDLLKNVGIVCGRVSGNLVVIDLDGIEAVAAFEDKFPHLQNTYSVATGSGKGRHVYFYSDKLPPTTRAVGTPIGNLELRSDGAYVVAPPSLHPTTGMAYTVSHHYPVARVLGLETVVNWITEFILAKRVTYSQHDTRTTLHHADWWAQAALEKEADAVRLASEGSRNDRLNLAAFKLGQLVQLNRLSSSEVERTLLAAAQSCGLSDDETHRTIQSGLTAGMTKPIHRS